MLFDGVFGHFPALGQGLLKVFFNARDTGGLIQIGGALEVVIQAAVVQIDRAYYGLAVVTDKDLGWTKPGVYS